MYKKQFRWIFTLLFLALLFIYPASFASAADPADMIFADSFERCDFSTQVPAGTIEWDGGGDGTSWSDELNWKGDALPVDNDDVSIRIDGGATVTYDNSLETTSLGSLDSCELLTITGGTLELKEDSRIRSKLTITGGTLTSTGDLLISGSLEQSGGTVNGAGTITVNGIFIWTDGFQSGSGTTIASSGMTASAPGNNRVLHSRTLTLNGASSVSGGFLYLWDTTINNNAPLTISNDADIPYYTGGNSNFYNISTVTKTSGSGVSEIGADFHNSGTVTVNNGELWVGWVGSATSTGDYQMDAGTILGVKGSNTMTGASSFTGDGGFTMINGGTGGTTTIEGSYSASGPLMVKGGTLSFAIPVTISDDVTVTGGTLDFTQASVATANVSVSAGTLTAGSTLPITGTLTQSGGTVNGAGTITVNGIFIWTDGFQSGSGTTIASSGMTASAPGNNRVLHSRTLTLNGASSVSGGFLYLWDTTINNNAPLTISNDADIPYYTGGNSNFYNISTVTKTSGSGVSEIGADFHNSGTVTVNNGELWVGWVGSATSTGDYQMDAGTILGVKGSNTMTGASSFTGDGGFTMINGGTGGTTTIEGSYSASGPLMVKGGTLSFAIPVTISDDVTVTGGTLDFTQASVATANVSVSAGTLTAGSTLPITGTLTQSGGTVNGAGTITVNGIFIWTDGFQSGSGTTIASSGMTASAPGNNRVLHSRTLTLNGASSVSGGFLYLWDTTINNNAPLTISNDADIPYYTGGNSNFYNISTVTKTSGSGVSEIGADFHNSGTVTVSSGRLEFKKAFTQTGTGILNVSITSLSSFDSYAVTDEATLDGTLTITLEGGYMPVNTDSFDILSAFSVSGTFTTVSGASIGNGNKFVDNYEATKVVLDVVPE